VVRTGAVPEHPSCPVHQTPDCGGFLFGQLAQSRDVTLRLHHQVPAVDVRVAHHVHVPHVDQVVFVEDATLGGVTPRLLVADEAGGFGHNDILSSVSASQR
jgi:hypothetical protein